MFSAKIIGNKIEIITDDPTVEFLLQGYTETKEYLPWKKCYGLIRRAVPIYDKLPGGTKISDDLYRYHLGLGWAGYLLGIFQKSISSEDYNNIASALRQESYRDVPFSNLRDYQNEDVLHILKYKVGLYQVNTSYGK